MRYWTSDLHFQHKNVLTYCNRPFKTIERMNEVLINNINSRATSNDTLIHLGDLMFYGTDKNTFNGKLKEDYFLNQITPKFVNIQGNHDKNNKVTSISKVLITNIGHFTVSASHKPSNELDIKLNIPFHLCGHVHNQWKHFYDKQNKVLNINVGIDAWNYNIVSDEQLLRYLIKTKKELHI